MFWADALYVRLDLFLRQTLLPQVVDPVPDLPWETVVHGRRCGLIDVLVNCATVRAFREFFRRLLLGGCSFGPLG